MISLGFWIADTYEGDTVAVNRRGSKFKGNDYCEMGFCMDKYVTGKNTPVVFVWEGGYWTRSELVLVVAVSIT